MKPFLFLFLGIAALCLPLAGAATDLDLGRTGAVAGVVVDAHGHRVAGAEVLLRMERHPGVPPFEAHTHTDHHGRFGFRHVPAGEGAVLARKPHVGRGRTHVVVHAGHVARVHLRLH